ncbi:MAG: Protein-arginine kinase [Eubacteriales bacterium SKADARSKE-1]|nr:Protein-arginine kinase [Eubacteriales bacterium SKADARSKE-1]
MDKWYEKSGADGDVVISTRIRLARNLSEFPFPCKLQKKGADAVINLVKEAVLSSNSQLSSNNFKYIDTQKLDKITLISLVEKHLLSPDFVSDKIEKSLILSENESISIMINEEDHVRLQVMSQGFDLEKTFEIADSLDSLLDEKLSFAFDDKLGYLTQCPTNLGTGMRASLMLHLPGLKQSGVMEKVSANLLKLGLTMRGIYGEGSEPQADMYQLSNQVTLGLSEKTTINNLKDIAKQIILQERTVRSEMAKHIETIDFIHRAIGVLKNARLISTNEFMKLISAVRLGVALGEIKGVSLDTINFLMIEAQPAMLSKFANKDLTAIEKEQKRADLIREIL